MSMVSSPPLGRLLPVEPRSVWAHEAHDFTPWLAQPENLALLGEAVGIQIETEATEAAVGGFSADIVARDLYDGSRVLIENQLEATDHTHLGQLLTYLAGLDARTVVWVCRRLHDEHRAALEWLNANTDARFRFFAIEVELWRIGASTPAPRFSVMVRPNDWVRRERAQLEAGERSTESMQHLAFWQALAEWLIERAPEIERDKPTRGRTQWLFLQGRDFTVSVNRTKAGLVVFARPFGSRGDDAFPEAQARLAAMADRLATALGPQAKRGPGEEIIVRRVCNADDTANWPEQFAWILDRYRQISSVLTQVPAA